jgi:hypothetical protein
MTALRYPTAGLSPREQRADPIAVRDINTGHTIACYNGSWEEYVLQHVGRIGYVDTFMIDDLARDDTYEVVTYRYSHGDKAEIIAYIGRRVDRDRVNELLFPQAIAAE